MGAKGSKKNFLFISRDVFRTTYRERHASQKEWGYVCVYAPIPSVCVCWWRGKRAGWKMLLTVLFRPAASFSSPPPFLIFPSISTIYPFFHLPSLPSSKARTYIYACVPTTTTTPYIRQTTSRPRGPFFFIFRLCVVWPLTCFCCSGCCCCCCCF